MSSTASATIPTSAVTPLGVSERASFFCYQRVLLVVWRDVPQLTDIEQMAIVVMRFKEQGPFAVVQRLAPSSRMPDAQTRSLIMKTWLRVGYDLIAMEMMLLAEGFWASAARSVINGMIMASGQRAPIRISAAAGEHTPWLLKRMNRRLGHAPAQVELLSALEEAKRAAHAP